MQGAFACSVSVWPGDHPADATAGQGHSGYCHISTTAAATSQPPPAQPQWSCCRIRPNNRPLAPAPPRLAKVYPKPPATRPPPGKANVVLILTDDEDRLLGSLGAMNTTRSLFQDGVCVTWADRFFRISRRTHVHTRRAA